MSRVVRLSLTLDRSPVHVRGRCLDGACLVAEQEAGDQETAAIQAASETDAAEAVEELRGLLAAIEGAVSDAEDARRQSINELQQLAIELSTAIAGELVFRSIDANEFDVGRMVAEAVEQLGIDTPLSIALHPSDAERLEALAADGETVWQSGDVTLQPDATVARGHCRATNGSTTLLSEIGPRWEEIRSLLWEGLDDAQIERRQAAGFDSPLKRFPDRRETA